VIGDLDNDGSLEIVFAKGYYLRVYNTDGSIDPSFNKDLYPTRTAGTPAIDDLDDDGDLEVVIGADDNNVYAWHHDGTAVAGWPKSTGGEIESSPALGDLERDGQMEVVIGSNDGSVYAWHSDGSVVAGWPKAALDEVSCSPVLGDIDGDMDLEIIVGSNGYHPTSAAEFKIFAWHHDGTAVAGWPKDVTQRMIQPASPALVDIDIDGDLEIIAVSCDNSVNAWEGDGTSIAGWPVDEPAISGYEFWVSSPVAGDIDGDGDIEIIMEGSGKYSPVYAFHHDGAIAAGWPKRVGFYSNSSPAIADIDQDGDVEIIIGSHGLFVWDLPGSYTKRGMEWPFYRHDIQRTGRYRPKAETVLLFDTSGSMSWRHDGTMGVPVEEQRLTLAKRAAYPFMELLNDFNAGKANFGIAVFPLHPWTWAVGCNGQVITPMTLIADASKNAAVTTTIPSLVAEGNTPLLAGLGTAARMFGPETNRAIVLLSDGYHNCPSHVDIANPEVTKLVNQLSTESIQVFTIGFGQPTDVDHPLLEMLAEETGGQFYDVTCAGFDPAAWSPATDLQATYKAILVDALGLQTATDPMGVIEAGEQVLREVNINEHDNKVSFFLSWVTPEKGRLGFCVKSSDGQKIPTTYTATGVHFHAGATYQIISVDRSFLQQPGKVGPTPWKIEIDARLLKRGELENYHYSVVLDSALRMNAVLDKTSYRTGDTITISTEITERGLPVTGLMDVYARVTRPQDGAGNWYAMNQVSDKELAQIPEKRGDEKLSLLQRKALFLNEIRKVAFPGKTSALEIGLYDDGTHGDAAASDGIYTNRYTNTAKEGTYAFHFHAHGMTSEGNAFDREDTIQKYISVKIVPGNILVNVVELPSMFKKLKRYMFVITPRDAFGNYLGPGYLKAIELATSKGKFVNNMQDNLDGTYGQMFQVPRALDIKEMEIELMIKGKRWPLACRSGRQCRPASYRRPPLRKLE
jgi:hypothetical protein